MDRIWVNTFDPGSVNFAIGGISVRVNTKNKSEYYGIKFDWVDVINSKYPPEVKVEANTETGESEGTKKRRKYKRKTDKKDQSDSDSDGQEDNPDDCSLSETFLWKPRPKNPETQRSSDGIIDAYTDELLEGKQLEKMRMRIEKSIIEHPHRKVIILIESQIDHIVSHQVDNQNLYVVTRSVLRTKYGSKNINFVNWHGKNKSGLKDAKGKERKEMTAPIAMKILRSEGFKKQAKFIENLPKPKPQEDVADIYLQAREYLLLILHNAGYKTPDGEFETKRAIQRSKSFAKVQEMPNLSMISTTTTATATTKTAERKKTKTTEKKRTRDSESKYPTVEDADTSTEQEGQPPVSKRAKTFDKKVSKENNNGKKVLDLTDT